MLSICIYSPVFYPSVGGLENITHILGTEFSRAGNRVEIVTETLGVSQADDLTFPYKITRASNYWSRVKIFQGADAVLLMNVSLHGLASAVAVSDTTVILTHHGIYRARGLVRGFLEFVKRESTRFFPNISVSQFVAEKIPGRSKVIHNAYDDALFTQPRYRQRDFDFVFCGRLVSEKGADVCLRAFALVADSYPDATLTIVGEGPDRGRLSALANELGILNNVFSKGLLTGAILVRELQKHTCMLVPSLWEEPFGIVALEGLACCRTVIVSSRGGLPEAVGDCGVIVEPTVSDFAEVMRAVVHKQRTGGHLPGEPQANARERHLQRHAAHSVSREYLDFISTATRSKHVNE